MLVVVTVSTGVPAVILSVAYKYFWQLGLALESFWCYQILATKSLKVESDRVYIALKDKGLEAGRKAVSMIVGRDTQNLTEERQSIIIERLWIAKNYPQTSGSL